MTRLPIPGRDSGAWGTILNDFLRVSHNQDGTLKVNKNDVGLGNVDDTSDINKPISTPVQTALNNGGVTFFPPGIYIHTGLTLPSGAYLLGVGSGGYVKNYPPTNQSEVPVKAKSTLRLAAGANADALLVPTDASHGVIENIEIDGNKTNQTTNTGCIKFSSATNAEEAQWKLNNIYVHSGRSYGLYVGTNRLSVYSHQSVYALCGVSDATGGSGIILSSTDNTIDSCLVFGSWGDNLKILSGTNRI